MAITLKAARVNKGLTQAEAAKLLDIQPVTLRGYERGDRFPPIETVKKIEEVYGVTYNDLIFLPQNAI